MIGVPPERLKVGVVQMSMSTDPAVNLDRASKLVSKAAEEGAKLVCLPELFSWHYFCQTEDPAHFELAESVPGLELFSAATWRLPPQGERSSIKLGSMCCSRCSTHVRLQHACEVRPTM